MISLPGLKNGYSHVHNPASDLKNQDASDAEHLPSSSSPRQRFWAWLGTAWPLALHFIGALGIAALLRYYIDENHFNIRDRMPAVTLADGTIIRTSRFSPLQSDINTILSASLVVLRWIAAAWAGPLCWRALFFLMEKIGLRRRDLEWLIGYGFFPPSTYPRHAFIVIVAVILTSTLFAQSASPILTGSITWTPSSISSGVQSDAFVNVTVASSGSPSWAANQMPEIQAQVSVRAAGFANQAWGRDTEKGVLKRVLPSSARLNINSTIANVTLPYFQVTALEWFADPAASGFSEWTFSQLGMQAYYLDRIPGMLALDPDTSTRPPPPPSNNPVAVVGKRPWLGSLNVSETAILALNVGWTAHSFSQNIGCVGRSVYGCWAFARVNYTAGAGVCTNCRLSAPSTVQNDSEISLQPDTMTIEALWNMPNVTANLLLMNTSIPLPWENVDDFVLEMLSRSYSAGWSALHEVMANPSDAPLTLRVYPTLPSLQAQLDLKRVYAWLALQLLVTCTGILFLWLQSRSEYALLGDTTMVSFDLDTSNTPRNNESSQAEAKSLLKIEPKEDGWKVVADPQSPSQSP